MLIALLDESARNDDFSFMGTVIVNDESIVKIEAGLDHIGDMIAQAVPRFDPHSEFHGYDMFHGEGAWRGVPIGWRVKACKLAVKTLAASGARYIVRGIDVNAHTAEYRRPFAAHPLCTAQTFETIDEVISNDDAEGAMVLVGADEHHSAPDSRRNLRSFKDIERPRVHEPSVRTHRRHHLLRAFAFEPAASDVRRGDVLRQPAPRRG